MSGVGQDDMNVPVGNDYGYTYKINKCNHSHMMIVSQNIRSSNANGGKLKDMINFYYPHVICIQETWGSDVLLNNYTTISNHRQGKGGGVSIMAKSDLNLTEFHKLSSPDIEVIMGKLNNHMVMNIYRPPTGNLNGFIKSLTTCVGLANDTNLELIVSGDFNIKLNDHNKWSIAVTNVLLDQGLIISTRHATRLTQTCESLIDANFVKADNIIDCGILTTSISDHLTPFVRIMPIKEK